jgi:hypothetical protein
MRTFRVFFFYSFLFFPHRGASGDFFYPSFLLIIFLGALFCGDDVAGAVSGWREVDVVSWGVVVVSGACWGNSV